MLLAAVLQTAILVDRGDYVINADVVGSGRPVVAIAGGPGFSGRSVWGIGFGMRERCRTYLFDQLGTGKSRMKDASVGAEGSISLAATIEDLEALRKRAGHSKWTVVGQSWGVIVGLVYAAKYPKSIDHLVLTSVPGLNWEGMELGVNLDKKIPKDVMDQLVAESLRQDLTEAQKTEAQVLGGLPYYFHNVDFGKSLALEAPKDLFSADVFNALRKHILNTEAYAEDLKRLKEFKKPVTLIQGHQDPCGAAMPYSLKERYVPQAKVFMLSRCGHFGWIEQRVDFFYALHEALKLPMPQYLVHGFEFDHPTQGVEQEAMRKAGWPFRSPRSGT